MGKQQMATAGYKREHGLTVEQHNAIDLLVTGKTDQDTAEAVSVNRVTVTKWRLYDPYFQAELNRRRQDTWGTAADRLRAMVPKALGVLEAELDQGGDKAKVAVQVLKLVGLEKLGKPAGAIDGDELLGDLAQAQCMRRLVSASEYERKALLADLEKRLAEDET
ncbi:MAG: hypothetical protein Q8P22_09865 [Chloroflexota bacterium]|nr:hypothetical protein [Chloroflexota bacterium]